MLIQVYVILAFHKDNRYFSNQNLFR